MTNYEKMLQEMTVDRMAEFMYASDECAGTHTDEEFECHSPADMSCRQCLKIWLMQEVKQD